MYTLIIHYFKEPTCALWSPPRVRVSINTLRKMECQNIVEGTCCVVTLWIRFTFRLMDNLTPVFHQSHVMTDPVRGSLQCTGETFIVTRVVIACRFGFEFANCVVLVACLCSRRPVFFGLICAVLAYNMLLKLRSFFKGYSLIVLQTD
jgi:hypothetical protein